MNNTTRQRFNWPIDMEAVHKIVGGHAEELLPDLLPLYCQDAGELIKTCEQAHNNGEIEVLARATQTLKTSSSNLGIITIALIARQIQDKLYQRQPDDVVGLLHSLRQEFSEVRSYLLVEKPNPANLATAVDAESVY